ncbi:MAG: acyl-CoA synthetase [Marinospirillum sp.]|uniref:AMP-binding protein n=1 Tax=Marinospirillum sp. TaxID=2183934 RepID=UPI0019FB8538|nr:AMP-binding protein [Marinospirillum sp.]MBE0506869.1 acyl-CoA synthetase [Marinospirillum sp.]
MDCQKKSTQPESNEPSVLIPVGRWLDETRDPAIRIARQGSEYLSLEQLREQVGQLVGFLQPRQETRWALCFEDSGLFLVALLALLHSRKTPVIPGHCLDGPLNEQQQHYDAVLTDLSLNLLSPTVRLLEVLESATPVELLPISPDATLTLFTSGSTGQPKKITKSLAAMDAEARWLVSLFSRQAVFDQVQATVTHQHLYGLTFRLWLPLSLGIPFDTRMKTYQEELAINVTPATLLITSPAFIKRLDVDLDICHCAGLVSAGGVLPWPDAQRVQQWTQCTVTEIYGSTETGVLAWRYRDTENPAWTPFIGVHFESGTEEQPGRVFSPLIEDSSGYPVNDQLIFNDKGQFQICGRLDRTVKIEEKRISLDEVEQRLRALPQVADAAVVLLENPQRARLGAVIILSAEGLAQQATLTPGRFAAGLREMLHGWLEPVAIPKNWRFVNELPINSMGKMSQPLLKELFDHATDKA